MRLLLRIEASSKWWNGKSNGFLSFHENEVTPDALGSQQEREE